jgi:hypothetical protein
MRWVSRKGTEAAARLKNQVKLGEERAAAMVRDLLKE